MIGRFLDEYNNQRPRRGLGMMTKGRLTAPNDEDSKARMVAAHESSYHPRTGTSPTSYAQAARPARPDKNWINRRGPLSPLTDAITSGQINMKPIS